MRSQNMEYWIIKWFDYNLKIGLKQLLYDVTWYDRMKTEPCSNVASSHIHHSTFTTQTCDLSLKESALRGGSSKKTTDENGSDENAHKSIMKVIKWIWTGIYCLWQAILVTSDLLKKKKKKEEKLDHARSANRSIICHHDHKLQSESRKLHHLIRGLVFDWHFGQKVKKNISKIIFCFFQPWSHFP